MNPSDKGTLNAFWTHKASSNSWVGHLTFTPGGTSFQDVNDQSRFDQYEDEMNQYRVCTIA